MNHALTRVMVGASIFLLSWPLALYPALLLLIARLRGRPSVLTSDHNAELPSLTVIVPTYMEIANIVPRVENIAASDYPRDRLEVIIVDSASGDGTADAADAFARSHPELALRVLREPRRGGKAAATNLALQQSTTDLVLVTDAPTRFDQAALRLVALRFDDPRVGAATGQFSIFEQRTATQREESLFWRIRNVLRTLEADVDSTPFLSGEFCCFRRALVHAIDADSIADDMNASLQVRRQGFRAVVEPSALFTEPRAAEIGDLLVRKVSRAAGGVQELVRNRDMLFRPRYGLFGVLILPSALLYYIPLRLPALAIVAAAFRPRRRQKTWAVAAGSLTLVAMCTRRRQIVDAAYTALLSEWLFLRGWQTVLTKRTDVLWDQEKRSVVPGADWATDQRAVTASQSKTCGDRSAAEAL